ncbi:hypothetical protein FRB94_012935 [Tulasnella sp. JGI-2019a]|nr:hypothetical protein FRB94_012935 [Tulasnella sp. JGI-2019a]KAG8995064.1 hypothetical protein FRB93_001254 [Tulasnella sp. JGI-2019a]
MLTHQPVLASSNPRYRTSFRIEPRPVECISALPAVISVGNFSDGKTGLPKGWRERVHAEGDTYFTHDDRKIVTANDPRDPFTQDILIRTHEQFKRSLTRDRAMQSELYLHISGTEQPDGVLVRYYFADHATCQLFWVDEVPLANLGLQAANSLGEIKSRLTPEYWTHVEYFPMHLPVRREAEDQLVGILRHGCVDNMTSPGSTFPFSEEECRKYLKIFEGFRSQDPSPLSTADGYRNAVIARIWNAIARARHINSFGLERPRLDRLQGVSEFSRGQMQPSKTLKLGETLAFGLSREVLERLSEMWNGRVVYQRHWQIFFRDMRADWLRIAGTSAIIWLGSTALLASGVTNIPLLASTALSSSSAFVALALCHKHREDILATGPDISRYIMSVENYYHGLRPLSIILVLPHALTAYSAALFSVALTTLAIERARYILEAIAFVVATIASAVLPVYAVLAYFDPSLDAMPYVQKVIYPIKAIFQKFRHASNEDAKVE